MKRGFLLVIVLALFAPVSVVVAQDGDSCDVEAMAAEYGPGIANARSLYALREAQSDLEGALAACGAYTYEFFSDFEEGLAGFNESFRAERGGVLEIIDDPTGSGRGRVLRSTVTGESDDPEGLTRIYPDVHVPFQNFPCRFQEDFWMSESVFEDLQAGRSGWFSQASLFDCTVEDDCRYHAMVTTAIWSSVNSFQLDVKGLNHEHVYYTDVMPDAPVFTPETWHSIVVEIDESGEVSLYQDGALVARGPLDEANRGGLAYVHAGLYAGPGLREGGYILEDNYTIVCGP